MVEFLDADKTQRKAVERSDAKKCRPVVRNFKPKNVNPVLLKKKIPLAYDWSKFTWLANKYMEHNDDQYPTVNELIKCIIE